MLEHSKQMVVETTDIQYYYGLMKQTELFPRDYFK